MISKFRYFESKGFFLCMVAMKRCPFLFSFGNFSLELFHQWIRMLKIVEISPKSLSNIRTNNTLHYRKRVLVDLSQQC